MIDDVIFLVRTVSLKSQLSSEFPDIYTFVYCIWTHDPPFCCTSGFLSISTLRSLWLYLSLSLPPSLTFSVGLSVSLCLSLSPWPVWSVIEGAVFTWPIGIEGTLCALWRQIALLAPLSLYLSFTFLLLLLLSSYSAHTLITLLVSPLDHHYPLARFSQLFHLLGPFNRFKIHIRYMILRYCNALAHNLLESSD